MFILSNITTVDIIFAPSNLTQSKLGFLWLLLYLVVFILSTLSRNENNEIRIDTDLALKHLYVMLCRLTWKSWWWNLSTFNLDIITVWHLKTKHKPIHLYLGLGSMHAKNNTSLFRAALSNSAGDERKRE